MEVKDLAGVEKPLEKLIKTVSNGIGVASNALFKFDEREIKRIGKAEADVTRIKLIEKAKADVEVSEIMRRAKARHDVEQYNKQVNLENIIAGSAEKIKSKKVSEEKVDKDWTSKFINIAQDTSREDLQEILSNILAGEVESPGTFSYQTLEVVKYLSKKDLEDFIEICSVSSEMGFPRLGSSSIDSFSDYGLDYDVFIKLVYRGLFDSSSTMSKNVDLGPNGDAEIALQREIYRVCNETSSDLKIKFNVYLFTIAGREIYNALPETHLLNAGNKKTKGLIKKRVLASFEEKGCVVEKVSINNNE